MIRYAMEDIFSESNIEAALLHLSRKRDSCGSDGLRLSQLRDYWEKNGEKIIRSAADGSYVPGIVQITEILNKSGKTRKISKFTSIDRLVLRAAAQALQPEFETVFSPNCCAYRLNMNCLQAVHKCAEYIMSGLSCVVKLDIENFFDTISQQMLAGLLEIHIADRRLTDFIMKFIRCRTEYDFTVTVNDKGIIQGNPLSPMLSNLYLMGFDRELEKRGLLFCRYGDDTAVYVKDREEGLTVYREAGSLLENQYLLKLNSQKSGVSDSLTTPYLGYSFNKNNATGIVGAYRNQNSNRRLYYNWKSSALASAGERLYFIEDGIITKKDYSLMFENKNTNFDIPPETTDALNIFSDVIMGSRFFNALSGNSIRLAMYDEYSRYIGSFIPPSYTRSAKTMLKQAALYLDARSRLQVAKNFALSELHNLRSNLRYYNKQRYSADFASKINILDSLSGEMQKIGSINELLLLEARAKESYYECINSMLPDDDFYYSKRTRQPPEDALNSMISFGNTLLYNILSGEIYKTSLDIRIAYLHSSGDRGESLHLDIADVLKPVIVDRTIFSLVNKHMINENDHFYRAEKGVFLNKEGKRLFIDQFEKKLAQKLTVRNRQISYHELIRREVKNFLSFVTGGEKYIPFKYYN